jgi:hypothetical protein
MIDHEDFKPLFEFLKVQCIPKIHWTNKVSWEMAKNIKNEVRSAIKIAI